MDSPSQPSTPDPTATAAAQGASNRETAITNAQLNRFNQVTPGGTLTWSMTPPTARMNADGTPVLNADGTPVMDQPLENSWTSTQTLSPQAQQIYDAQMGAGVTLSGGLQPFAQRTVGAFNAPAASMGQAPDSASLLWNTYENTVQPAQENLASVRPLAEQYNSMAGNLASTAETAAQQYGANVDAVSPIPTPDAAYRDQVTSALYDQNASRLDPQWQQAESDAEARLAAQGITHGSAAYDRDYGNLQRAKTDAYQTARNSAIAGGTAAQQAQFGMGLQANQAGMDNALAKASNPMNLASSAQGMNSTQQSSVNAGLSGLLASEAAMPSIANDLYGYHNQGRLQNYTDQQMQQNNLLAQLSAMNTGSAVASPTFTQQNVGANMANTDVSGIVNNAYQGQMNGYNAQVGQQNSLIGAAGMLGAAGIRAW